MQKRNVILTIDVVEPGLVKAVQRHARRLDRELSGIVLVEKTYADNPNRLHDITGLFKEIICDFDNPDEIQQLLKPYQERLLAAIISHEFTIQPFQKVIPFLPYIPVTSESSLKWSTQKQHMRDRMRTFNPDLVPRYKHLTTADLSELSSIVADMNYPVIVKPSWLAESLLVTRCNNYQELYTCLTQTFSVIQEVYRRERRELTPSVLIEEMIQGDMYSIDAYVQVDGTVTCLPPVRVITAEMLGKPGGFYAYWLTTPDNSLSDDDVAAAYQATTEAIHALNLSAATCYAELFLTKNGWKLIEVAPRHGGYRDHMYRSAYNIDHWYNDLAVRMGDVPIELPGKPTGYAAGICIYPDVEGVLKTIEGIDEVKREVETLTLLDVRANTGSPVLFSNNGGLPVIDVELGGKSKQQVEHDMHRVRELIKIVVE